MDRISPLYNHSEFPGALSRHVSLSGILWQISCTRVVCTDDDYSPIYTYNRQGCTKHGVKQHEHGIIYEDLPGNTGQLLSNEKTLGFPSIRARTTNGEPMDNASRVNYAKITDIGHNLKVNFIAEVVPEDWNIAKNALKTSGFC